MVRIQGDRLRIILDLEGFVRIFFVLQTLGGDFANEQAVSFCMKIMTGVFAHPSASEIC